MSIEMIPILKATKLQKLHLCKVLARKVGTK